VVVGCDTRSGHCNATPFATLGDLIIPLPAATWLGVQGPRWSWDERALRGPVVAFALGWSHEQAPHRPGPDAAATWDPPRPDEVRAYRHTTTSWLFFLSATAASTAENQWVGGGLELRRDLDRWDHRAGWAPALSLSLDHGTVEGTRGTSLAIAPTVRAYLLPGRIAVAARPAFIRVGALAGHSLAADVAGLLALSFDLGRLELSIESPPLSYVSRARWHGLPFSVLMGLFFD
jgi:hypothetical protein